MTRTTVPLVVALALAFAGPAAAADPHPPLKPVPELDLQRYAGTWHEIARLPMDEQAECARDVTATYTLDPGGTIAVRNECSRTDGSRLVAEGMARRGDAPAKLEVRFAPRWLAALPFVWGDYWVIALDEDYRWAIVGEPDRDHLWILSRERVIDARTLEGLKARARMHGYDLRELIVNP